MKKLLLVLLAICMLLGCVACKSNKQEGVTTAPPAQEQNPGNQEQKDPHADYLAALPERNWENDEFKILITAAYQSYYEMGDESESPVDQAGFERNLAAEEKYGVAIEYIVYDGNSSNSAPLVTAIRTAAESEDPFDLCMAQASYMMPLASEGYFTNVLNNQYMHMDKEWYHQSINEMTVIGNKQYAFSNEFISSQIGSVMVLHFNKTMYKNRGFTENLYDLVDNKQWTYDKMYSLVQGLYQNLDEDDDVKSQADQFGIVGAPQIINCLMRGMGNLPVVKDKNNEWSIDHYYSDRLIKSFDKMMLLWQSNDSLRLPANADNAKIFAEGRSLFMSVSLGVMFWDDMKNMTIDNGILPFPLYDEQQETYYHSLQRWELNYIPKVADVERAAIVSEYLAFLSYRDFLPVYWNEAILVRKSDTEDDMRMLNLIRDTMYFGFEEMYVAGLSGLGDMCAGLIASGKNELGSTWSTNKESFKESLEIILEDYS